MISELGAGRRARPRHRRLQKLLSIPYEGPLASGVPLTRALLGLDPMFDPLRNDPRFHELIASPTANNTKR